MNEIVRCAVPPLNTLTGSQLGYLHAKIVDSYGVSGWKNFA